MHTEERKDSTACVALAHVRWEVTIENIIYVGADVRKDTNSVCMFDWNDGSFFAEAVIEPGVENMIKYISVFR